MVNTSEWLSAERARGFHMNLVVPEAGERWNKLARVRRREPNSVKLAKDRAEQDEVERQRIRSRIAPQVIQIIE